MRGVTARDDEKSASMICTPGGLNQFVAAVDALGGPSTPASAEYWAGFVYQPGVAVNQDLDPFGEAYVAEQFALYEEVSGHRYDVHRNEMTDFAIERHIAAANPYDHPDPAVLAIHLQRLSAALRYAAPRRGETLLDMGCGWGLSSELAAYLGLSVTAVDINPHFVRLVRERAATGHRAIKAELSTFEDFRPAEAFDISLFYECLHHAVRPWTVTAMVAGALKPGGRLVLAGEPINANWWRHWGLRLDPLSIYCIRKFGWFESGWSMEFIHHVLYRSGLLPRTYPAEDPAVGAVIVAEKPSGPAIPGDVAARLFGPPDAAVEDGVLHLVGAGKLVMPFRDTSRSAVLTVVNHRPAPLRALLSCGGTTQGGDLSPGEHVLTLPWPGASPELRFSVERWVPDDEIHNGDRRTIGLHLRSIEFRS